MVRIVLSTLAAVASVAAAQDFDALFRWSAAPGPHAVRPGGAAVVDVTLTVADKHMVYRSDLTFSAEGPAGVAAGEATYAPATRKWDEFSQEDTDLYPAGTYAFKVPVHVPVSAAGVLDATVTLRYRGCSDSICFFPQSRRLPVALHVAGEPAAGGSGGSTPVGPGGREFAGLLGQGRYLALLLLLFGTGLATSLLPCVYPIVPITIGVIGAAGAKTKAHAFLLSLVFVLGMCVMFAALGVVAGLTGQLSGSLMNSPWMGVVLAAIFVAMALSLFGLFEMKLPASLSNRLSQVGGQGYAGAFGMGLVSGVLATPCTGPVLIGILTYIAQTQNPVVGFWALFVFALGLGMLFLVVGTFSGLLSALPRSGDWMDRVKSVFGVVFLAVALYYLQNTVPALKAVLRPSPGPILAGVALALVGLALGAVHLKFRADAPVTNARKAAGALAMACGLFVALASPLAEPPLPGGWLRDHDGALERGRKLGKPVMVDFYTQSCTNCKKLVRDTFAEPRVAKELERFVVAKVDLTNDTAPESARLIERYGIRGVPLVVFYTSEGDELIGKRINDFVPPDAFLEHIRDID